MAEDAVRERLLKNIHLLQPKAREAESLMKEFGAAEPRLFALWRELGRYQAGDDPCKAVYLIARCYAALERWATAYEAIEQLKDEQQKLQSHDTRKALEHG